jgi:hypothetical protein
MNLLKKQNVSWRNSICILVLALILASCTLTEDEKDMIVIEEKSVSSFYDKAWVTKAKMDEKLAYKNYHLTKLMEEVLRSNPNFEKQIKADSKKGNYMGILNFEDALKGSFKAKGEQKMNDSIQFSLDAFVGLEEESWTPYLEKIKEGRKDSPLFLINSYDPISEREIVIGYVLNLRGELTLKYRDVSEEDIFGNESNGSPYEGEVYALSLISNNEGLSQEEAQNCEECGGDGGGGYLPGSGGGNGSLFQNLEIEKLKIMDKKESWLEKADVYLYGYAMSENPNFFYPLGYYWGIRETIDGAQIRNNPEYRLAKFSNSDVDNGAFKTINYYLLKEKSESKTFISYIIYEYDGFPAPLKAVYFDGPGGNQAKISYRSYNQKYIDTQVRACDNFLYEGFSVMNGFGNTMKNSVIEYNYTPAN